MTTVLILAVTAAGCAWVRPRGGTAPTSWERMKEQVRLDGPAPLTAGAARVEITPAVGTPLAGYSKRRGKPSVGIRDPLYVRVLSVSDGRDTAVVVSADLLAFPYPLAERIIEQISVEHGIPRQAILLTTTHTHSGSGSFAPGFLHEQVFGPYKHEIEEGITGRVLWAVRQSLKGRKPVRWGLAVEPQALGGWVENRADPAGEVDPALSLLLFESAEAGRPAVLLVQAAAHPTLMDSQDMRFSADYPGEVCRLLEAAYPGSVCLFVNGAAGDVRPRDAIGADPEERIQRFARILSEFSTAAAGRTPLHAKGDLAGWGTWFSLPPPQLRLGPIPIHPELGRLSRPGLSFVHLIALDDVVIVPLPAELTAELGGKLRQRLEGRGLKPLPAGYANGYLGYAVSPAQYARGSYEAGMTWYGPGFGESLTQELARLAGVYEEKRAGR